MNNIVRYLSEGVENARTAAELSKLLRLDRRSIGAAVRRARLEGVPICATHGDNPGYYIAQNSKELEAYIASRKRAIELEEEALFAIEKTL